MNGEYIDRLSALMSRDRKDVEALMEGLCTIIRDNLCEMNEVALPGFGTFRPEKKDEAIVIDESTGKSVLMPPSISVSFVASALLRRKINEPR